MEQHNILKPPFDTKTLDHYKKLLIKKRREAEEQLHMLENRITELHEADDSDSSSTAHHMGDMGSNLEEEQMNYQLLERIKKYIRQVDAALGRIEKGTYGICQATGKPIAKGRLEAVPHTRYSIEAKTKGIANMSAN